MQKPRIGPRRAQPPRDEDLGNLDIEQGIAMLYLIAFLLMTLQDVTSLNWIPRIIREVHLKLQKHIKAISERWRSVLSA